MRARMQRDILALVPGCIETIGWQIASVGQITDISFEPVAGETNEGIDAAYREEYSSSP